jgi:hypothetical protein
MNKPLMDILAEGHYAANLDAVPGESYNTECESLVRKMLLHLGEDPGREGLERTPQRGWPRRWISSPVATECQWRMSSRILSSQKTATR